MIKIYDYTNVGKVFVCGDIHGEFKTLMYHIKTNSSALNDYVLDDHPLEIEEKKKAEEAREIARQERENMGLDDMLIPLRGFRSVTLKDCPCGDNKYENSLIFICGDGGIGFNREQSFRNEFSHGILIRYIQHSIPAICDHICKDKFMIRTKRRFPDGHSKLTRCPCN